MPSPLVDVRTQIAADWIALTPPTDTHVTYHDAETSSAAEVGHRAFVIFPANTAETSNEWGQEAAVFIYDFEAVLVLRTIGESFSTLFAVVPNESRLLAWAVNTRTGWPSGIQQVRCLGWTGRDTQEETIEITFKLRAWIYEAV